jgi:hypothetical protein
VLDRVVLDDAVYRHRVVCVDPERHPFFTRPGEIVRIDLHEQVQVAVEEAGILLHGAVIDHSAADVLLQEIVVLGMVERLCTDEAGQQHAA